MAVNHGFHATMTAQPGKGDELVEFLLNVPSLSGMARVGWRRGRQTRPRPAL